MGTRIQVLALALGVAQVGLGLIPLDLGLFDLGPLALGARDAAAQSVTVIRGGAKSEPVASSVEIVRGQATRPQSGQKEPLQRAGSAIGVAGPGTLVFAPETVTIVNCPPGDGLRAANCRVRIGPPERKRSTF